MPVNVTTGENTSYLFPKLKSHFHDNIIYSPRKYLHLFIYKVYFLTLFIVISLVWNEKQLHRL